MATARARGAHASRGGESFSRGGASAGVIVGWELVARAHTPRTAPSIAPSGAPAVAPPSALDAEGRRRRDLCELPSLPLLTCALPLNASPDGKEGQGLSSALPPAFAGTAQSDDVGA